MKQMSLGTIGLERKTKRTRKREFLDECRVSDDSLIGRRRGLLLAREVLQELIRRT
ncbi:MAG: hypothetical protein N2690_04715 [Rhodocyclaceae bacterium]|nr:hypothetical protein [Rhodocyclaceae bacterium]